LPAHAADKLLALRDISLDEGVALPRGAPLKRARSPDSPVIRFGDPYTALHAIQ
jgi:hypothetical protein